MKNILILILVIATLAFASATAYFYGKSRGTASTLSQLTSPTPLISGTAVSPSVIPSNTTTSQGEVTGKMCYPASVLPVGKIVAKNTATGQLTTQDYPGNVSTYSFKLAPGTYYLKYDAYVNGLNGSHLSGYYTDYSSCVGNPSATNCSGQKTRPLLPVVIEVGKTVPDVNLCDFYYPPDSPPSF